MAGNVPDWRQLAKGARYYVDEAARLERELNAAVASARVRINTGGDPSAYIEQIEEGIRELGEIPAKVSSEKRMLDVWLASETRGFFRQMVAPDYRSQFNEQYEIYELVLDAMPDTLTYFNHELSSLGET